MPFRGYRVGVNTSGVYDGQVSERDFMNEFPSNKIGFSPPPYTMGMDASTYWGWQFGLWDVNNNKLSAVSYGRILTTTYTTPWSAFQNKGGFAYYDIVAFTSNTGGRWINQYTLDSTSCKFFQELGGVANAYGGTFPEWQAGDVVQGFCAFGSDNSTPAGGELRTMDLRAASGQSVSGTTGYNNGNGNQLMLRTLWFNTTRGHWAMRMSQSNPPSGNVTQSAGPFSIFFYNSASQHSSTFTVSAYNAAITGITSSTAVGPDNGAYFFWQNFGADATGVWWGNYGFLPTNYLTQTPGVGWRLGIN